MLILSLALLVFLFLLNVVVGLKLGFGLRHYWFFESLHFFGGAGVAFFLMNIFSAPLQVLIGVFVISALWELMELAVDKIPFTSTYLKRKFHLKTTAITFGDTLLDLFLDMLGAAVFVWLFFPIGTISFV